MHVYLVDDGQKIWLCGGCSPSTRVQVDEATLMRLAKESTLILWRRGAAARAVRDIPTTQAANAGHP